MPASLQGQVWTSLEVAKLVVQLLTPAAVALLGFYFTRVVKRLEHFQWRNQRLIEKRIAVYDALAPDLNDLLCYFTFVGCWKDLTPPDVVARKRSVDKKVYLAAPMFSPEFFGTCSKFIGLCYATYQGWGEDARLRTPTERRRDAAGASWQPAWNHCFSDDPSDPKEIRASYQEVMRIFSEEIGIAVGGASAAVGGYPANIR